MLNAASLKIWLLIILDNSNPALNTWKRGNWKALWLTSRWVYRKGSLPSLLCRRRCLDEPHSRRGRSRVGPGRHRSSHPSSLQGTCWNNKKIFHLLQTFSIDYVILKTTQISGPTLDNQRQENNTQLRYSILGQYQRFCRPKSKCTWP